MSYRERRTVVSLISTILFATFYFVYVFRNYPGGNPYSAEVFHFWGVSMFILTPLSIAVQIAISIAFSIAYTTATRDKESRLSDARDRLIELRGIRNTVYVFAFGFLLAMGSLVINESPSVMFLIIFASGFVAGMVGDISQLFLYRRGF